MAKNFVQPGNVVTVPAPYNVVSGEGVLIGSLFGIATYSALNNAPVEIMVVGVWDLLAEGAGSSQSLTVGAPVYWDATNKRATKTPTSNTLIGVAVAAKETAATVVRVRLSG